jgi:hypothetical protein
MKVTIELISKPFENPYYAVSSDENGCYRCFSFIENAEETSIWNKETNFKNAREYALALKAGGEIREIIEVL